MDEGDDICVFHPDFQISVNTQLCHLGSELLLEWSCFSVLGSWNATISWAEPILGIRWYISKLGLVLVKSCHNNSLLQVCKKKYCSPSLPASEWASTLKFFVVLTSIWLQAVGYWVVCSSEPSNIHQEQRKHFILLKQSTWSTLGVGGPSIYVFLSLVNQ